MIMLMKTITSLAVAAACLTTMATVTGTPARAASPQSHNADVAPGWSPEQNIKESERYDRLVATDPAFRRLRMRIECGPITDPVLHQQCIERFQQEVQAWRDGQLQALYGSALYGSSTPPENYSSGSGQ
jgi:hypothetical protein